MAEPADEEQILSSGEVLIDAGVLTGHANHGADRRRVVDDVVTEDRRPSRVGFEDGAEDAHGGCLAGTVGSKQTQYAASLDLQVDPIQCSYRTEALGEAFSADHFVGRGAAFRRRHDSRSALGAEAAGGTAT